MDWMSFFWSWHTRDDYGGAGSKVSMTEIYDVLDRAATINGNSKIYCTDLRQAAKDKWGLGTNKYNNFDGWALAHGVKD